MNLAYRAIRGCCISLKTITSANIPHLIYFGVHCLIFFAFIRCSLKVLSASETVINYDSCSAKVKSVIYIYLDVKNRKLVEFNIY